MQVVLVMFRQDGERRSFSITRDVTVVGRREDCDFRIPLGEISRKHCRLVKDGDTLRVEDLGSSNGTFHNGTRIQNAELGPGDTLQIGSVAFVVQIDGTPTDDEMQPVTAAGRSSSGDASEGSGVPTDATLADGAHGGSNGSGNGKAHASGDFDPMTVLEAGGSGEMQGMEDSRVRQDIIIDLAGNSAA